MDENSALIVTCNVKNQFKCFVNAFQVYRNVEAEMRPEYRKLVRIYFKLRVSD